MGAVGDVGWPSPMRRLFVGAVVTAGYLTARGLTSDYVKDDSCSTCYAANGTKCTTNLASISALPMRCVQLPLTRE